MGCSTGSVGAHRGGGCPRGTPVTFSIRRWVAAISLRHSRSAPSVRRHASLNRRSSLLLLGGVGCIQFASFGGARIPVTLGLRAPAPVKRVRSSTITRADAARTLAGLPVLDVRVPAIRSAPLRFDGLPPGPPVPHRRRYAGPTGRRGDNLAFIRGADPRGGREGCSWPTGMGWAVAGHNGVPGRSRR